jgi:hypothetical protein
MEMTMVGRPWPKGVSGNQGGHGSATYREFTTALRIVVREIDPVTRQRKLRRIAQKVVDEAMKGEGWACNMVADRLEGRPLTEINFMTQRPIRELSDDELQALILEQQAKLADTPPPDEQLN